MQHVLGKTVQSDHEPPSGLGQCSCCSDMRNILHGEAPPSPGVITVKMPGSADRISEYELSSLRALPVTGGGVGHDSRVTAPHPRGGRNPRVTRRSGAGDATAAPRTRHRALPNLTPSNPHSSQRVKSRNLPSHFDVTLLVHDPTHSRSTAPSFACFRARITELGLQIT